MEQDSKVNPEDNTEQDKAKARNDPKHQDNIQTKRKGVGKSELKLSDNPPSPKPSTSSAQVQGRPASCPPLRFNIPVVYIKSVRPFITVNDSLMGDQPEAADFDVPRPLGSLRINRSPERQGYTRFRSPYYEKSPPGKIKKRQCGETVLLGAHSSSKLSKTASTDSDSYHTDSDIERSTVSLEISSDYFVSNSSDEDKSSKKAPKATDLQVRAAAQQPQLETLRSSQQLLTSSEHVIEPELLAEVVLNKTHQQLWRLERTGIQLFSFIEDLKNRPNQIQEMKGSDIINRMHSSAEILYKRGDKYPIFTISANQPLLGIVKQKLGYMICYKGECPRMVDNQLCHLRCRFCDVCSHMYSCSCPNELKCKGWCCHMHAAVQGGNNVFKAEKVFFHMTKRKMRLAHFRAMCYSESDSVLIDNNEYMVISPGNKGNGSGQRCIVSHSNDLRVDCGKCPNYKICGLCFSCRHKFKCNCDDYEKSLLLCEHCHVVALKLDLSVSCFGLKKVELNDDSDLTGEDSENSEEDEGRMARRQKRVIAAHHERALGIPAENLKIIKEPDEAPNVMDLVHKFQIKNSDGKKIYNVAFYENKCLAPDNGECRNFCLDCLTCEYRATCDCGKPPDKMCKHIHMVGIRRNTFKYDLYDT